MFSKSKVVLFSLLIGCALPAYLKAQSVELAIQNTVDSFYRAHPNASGIMIDLEFPDKSISQSYAVGYSDRRLKTLLSPSQPALIASITKTFVAATILKLVELKKLRLDQSIEHLIKKKSNKLLQRAGYKTRNIKVWHILSHTSGIADFVSDDYFSFVNANKKYRWTRDEQIALAAKTGKPISEAGDTFKYADINYLLASEIIEKITKKTYYQAVTNLLEFKKHNFNSTWFVTLQNHPRQSFPMVHQYYNQYLWDSYDIDPSWDLYGGGGIASTTHDLTRFFQLLFEGSIIHDHELLKQMCMPVTSSSNYCLGIRKISMNGITGYYHGGWWGTDVIYFPELKAAVSIFVLERGEKEISSELCKHILKIIHTQ